MAEPFLAEIRIMSFNFAPRGWALCNGQLLPINQNQALFSLLGTMYGGNGQTNFQLPNMQGRTALHVNSAYPQGMSAGESSHTLTIQEMPQHQHTAFASNTQANAPSSIPTPTAMLATSTGSAIYGAAVNLVPMAANSVSTAGGSQAHNNMQPYIGLTFCIALQGIFPSQN